MMPDPFVLVIGVVVLLLALGAVGWWATRRMKGPKAQASDPYVDALEFDKEEQP